MLLLLGLTGLNQVAELFALPLPVLFVGGALLAIASNYNKREGLPFFPPPSTATEQQLPTADQPTGLKANTLQALSQTTPDRTAPAPEPQLPQLTTPTTPPTRSISFTIRRSDH